ncbi:MAG: hypothetical protein K9I94_02840 [Bacteroidales bacterium]|nr:hypothetical protein [Bacteroidales bacterium]
MNKLEQYIKDNRQHFDANEPAEGHEERFRHKLELFRNDEKKKSYSRFRFYWRVAASIILLIGFSIVMVRYLTIENGQNLGQASYEKQLPQELKEVKGYYSSLAQEKLKRIETLTANDSEANQVKAQALQEVQNIEASSEQLERTYVKQNKDERVYNAIVNNYRIITGLLDRIINELNEESIEKKQSMNTKNKKDETYHV